MFSVIIPLYNKEHTIINTINTVFNQSFQDFEIIIVNDGSVDKGIEKINNHVFDNRVRIIDQKNAGVSAARNVGVENAKYNYIAFLDADDVWLPDYLLYVSKAISLFPYSQMICSAGFGKDKFGVLSKREIKKHSNKILEFDFFENPHIFLHISSTVVTKDIFNTVNGFQVGMRRNEDFAFLYSAALFTKPIYSGFPMSIYVGDVQGQATKESIYENHSLLRDIINRFNIVYENWLFSSQFSKTFIPFMKYELRHFFMINVLNNKCIANQICYNGLSNEVLEHLNFIDKKLIQNYPYKIISIIYFKITKVFWIMHGYQRVK